MLSVDGVRAEFQEIRKATRRPVNVNFFCHQPPVVDAGREAAWLERRSTYYAELGLEPSAASAAPARGAFDDAYCAVVEELRPEVVSFHFGLPDQRLVRRVKDLGAKVLSSATSVDEARWLEANGCDAIVAQGYEAGGHQGVFLTADVARQVGTMALVPQIVDAVRVPVIAAGEIADGRGIAAAFALGAAAVQIGTAYLRCPEASTSALHRAALASARDNDSMLTNVFTGPRQSPGRRGGSADGTGAGIPARQCRRGPASRGGGGTRVERLLASLVRTGWTTRTRDGGG